MKKSKLIVKKFSFQKVHFPHQLQISKFMHKFGVKSWFCPFSQKNKKKKRGFLSFKFGWKELQNCRGQYNKLIGVKIKIFRNKRKIPTRTCITRTTPGRVKSSSAALKILQSEENLAKLKSKLNDLQSHLKTNHRLKRR